MKALSSLQEYKVVGHDLSIPKCRTPPFYCMHIFATNHAVAKLLFWYFMSQLKKMNVYCGQCFRSSLCASRTLASGCTKTPTGAQITCTGAAT